MNPEEGMQPIGMVSYFGFISNNVIMKICLVLCNHIVQYTSYRSQKYKSALPYYDDKYPRLFALLIFINIRALFRFIVSYSVSAVFKSGTLNSGGPWMKSQ